MSGVHLRTFLGHLRRRLQPREAGLGDAQLLERFVTARDEAAFELLIWRHGGMVLNVCRRMLFQVQDMEDAFQATFLVLLKKAATISSRESLAAWLYRVAFRVALRARTNALKRQTREQRDCEEPVHPAGESSAGDLRPVLDEELNRLPARYRDALVLCYLQGKTNEEAAAELGCPRGTIFSRLSRGRELLRSRLVRRGVSVPTGILAMALAQHAWALPPARLLLATLQLSAPATVGGAIAPNVVYLTEGVTQTMFVKKLQLASVLGLTAFVGLSSGALVSFHSQDAKPDQGQPVAQAVAQPVAQPVAQGEGQAAQVRVAQAQSTPSKGTGGVGQSRTKVEARSAAEHSVAGSAPVVVKTEPQAGDTQVDAATVKEIRITFSKEMNEKGYSFSQISSEHFPKTTGKASFDKERRTCVLPVKLEPGKTYVIWLNPQKFQGFRDTDGRPAVFYPLVFETKP